MRGVRYDGEHVLQDLNVVRLVETLRCLIVLADVLQNLVEDIETRVGHVAHCVLESPDNSVENQLKLGWWQAEERGEAVIVDRLQQQVEIGPVLREVFEVLVDHVERALENSVKDLRYIRCGMPLELVHDGGHRAEHFGLAG